MLARIATGALLGIEAHPVEVEVTLTRGLPNTHVIGLPDSAVREARIRVENAFRSLGLALPSKRVTISLAPAGLRKSGSAYDLPIAMAMLVGLGVLPPEAVAGLLFAGELGLDGSLRPVRGVLALARLARAQGLAGVVVPQANAAEAALVPGLTVWGPPDLGVLAAHLRGDAPGEADASRLAPTPETAVPADPDPGPDLAEVRGQLLAKRALVLAAAGGHHLLMLGPPGTGKTMLARRLPGLLPPLTREEALEVTQVHSAAGLLPPDTLVAGRPFRAPHHTASEAALVGGGHQTVRVGEVSLAHHGVLFLDEVAEVPRRILDALRQPLEAGRVQVSRAELRLELPARAQLVLAMNPCPCGWNWEGAARRCVCPPATADRYLARLSGPLLDRIDLQVGVDPLPLEALTQAPTGPTSEEVRDQVTEARARQRHRQAGSPHPPLNAWLTPAQLRRQVPLDPTLEARLHESARRLGLTARGVDRVVRVARTAADLAGADRVALPHVLEALGFRGWTGGGEVGPPEHHTAGLGPQGGRRWA